MCGVPLHLLGSPSVFFLKVEERRDEEESSGGFDPNIDKGRPVERKNRVVRPSNGLKKGEKKDK